MNAVHFLAWFAMSSVIGIGSLCRAAETANEIDQYNVVWISQSENSGESMPVSLKFGVVE